MAESLERFLEDTECVDWTDMLVTRETAQAITGCVTDEEKVKACAAAKLAGAAFVKTSTGFSTGGAKVEDVRLKRQTVGPEMGVKASGGVRTYEDAVAMIEAGASRLGASAGKKIIEGARAAAK